MIRFFPESFNFHDESIVIIVLFLSVSGVGNQGILSGVTKNSGLFGWFGVHGFIHAPLFRILIEGTFSRQFIVTKNPPGTGVFPQKAV